MAPAHGIPSPHCPNSPQRGARRGTVPPLPCSPAPQLPSSPHHADSSVSIRTLQAMHLLLPAHCSLCIAPGLEAALRCLPSSRTQDWRGGMSHPSHSPLARFWHQLCSTVPPTHQQIHATHTHTSSVINKGNPRKISPPASHTFLGPGTVESRLQEYRGR